MDAIERKECVDTMAQQVRGQNIDGRLIADYEQARLRVSRAIQDNSDEHIRMVFNSDITYDRGRDLYNVTVYMLCMVMGTPWYGEVVAESNYEQIGWEQFPDIISQVRAGDIKPDFMVWMSSSEQPSREDLT